MSTIQYENTQKQNNNKKIKMQAQYISRFSRRKEHVEDLDAFPLGTPS